MAIVHAISVRWPTAIKNAREMASARLHGSLMKLILSSDVEALGRRGDVVDVSDGYARNYLLPRKLATKATDASIAAAETAGCHAAMRSTASCGRTPRTSRASLQGQGLFWPPRPATRESSTARLGSPIVIEGIREVHRSRTRSQSRRIGRTDQGHRLARGDGSSASRSRVPVTIDVIPA